MSWPPLTPCAKGILPPGGREHERKKKTCSAVNNALSDKKVATRLIRASPRAC
jgi:hypothetical protein